MQEFSSKQTIQVDQRIAIAKPVPQKVAVDITGKPANQDPISEVRT